MRLVERVVSKGQKSIPKGGDRRLRELVLHHALAENFKLLSQLFRLFLTHCSSKKVRLPKRVTGDLLGRSHYLLLVNNQTEGWTKNFFEWLGQFRVNSFNLLQSVFSLRIVGM